MSLDPRTQALTKEEETVEVLEVIEECDNYNDLDDPFDIDYSDLM